MIIETKKFKDVNRAPYNPRVELKPGMPEYEKLNKSIDKFDQVLPMVYNSRSGNLVGGHQTMTVLENRGIDESQMSIVDLDDADEKALNIGLNKITGLWDTAQLSELLGELSAIPDFDIELTGFDIDESIQFIHDTEVHNVKYKPGEGSITGGVDFIEDEIQAMTADDDAKELFKDKKTIHVTFSGGKDSTFALLWAKHNFPDKQIIATFSDTGVEFPGFPAHIKECCEFMEVEYNIVKPEKDMWVEILKRGWPNIIHRWCQHDFVYTPINKYYKTLNPSEIIIIDGSRADQTTRTTRKTKTSPPADKTMHKFDFYHPAFDVDRDLQEQILIKSGIPIWDGYDMGFQRTACWMCPGQNGDQALALSENYPGLVDVIRRWEKKIGKPLQESNDRYIDHMIRSGLKNRKRREKKAEE